MPANGRQDPLAFRCRTTAGSTGPHAPDELGPDPTGTSLTNRCSDAAGQCDTRGTDASRPSASKRLRALPEKRTLSSLPPNKHRSICRTARVGPELAQHQRCHPAGARALARGDCRHDRPWQQLKR